MKLEQVRKDIVHFGKKIVDVGLTKGTGGNISFYDRKSGLVAVTPTGFCLDTLTEEQIVVLNLAGEVIEGDLNPTSEVEMHLGVYRERPDINAVIHAHTTYASALACLQEGIPASHYMIAVAGKNVRCSKYATFGTPELAEAAVEAMRDRYAALLANHGVLTGSHSIANAYNILEEVEYCAKVYCIARSIGNPVILPDEEMELLDGRFKTYGQVK